jgi:hypothetical protein
MIFRALIGSGGLDNTDLTYSAQGTITRTSGTGTVTPGITHTGVAIGSEPAVGYDRYLVTIIGGGPQSGTNTTITPTVTINGVVSDTILTHSATNSSSFRQWGGILILKENIGTTATFLINLSPNPSPYAFIVYAIYVKQTFSISSFNSSTAQGSTSMSISLNTPRRNSIMFAGAQFRNGEITLSLSFGGTAAITTDFRADTSNGDENFYAGSRLFSSANTGLTVTATDATAAGTESILFGCVLST